MPVAKLTCPKCKSVLRPAKPLPSGKNVKCPKCGNVFKAHEEEIPDVIPLLGEEPSAQPAPAKTQLDDDEDTGPATYRFMDEPETRIERDEDEDVDEDEERNVKDDISIVPDLTVKDPRGIAQELIVRPSNWLMLMSVLDIAVILILMAYWLIPIFFSLPPDTSAQANQPGVAKGKETAKSIDWAAPTAGLANWLIVLLTFAAGGIGLAYNSAIVMGAVKMQNLESYGMCIAACILAMVPIGAPCFCYPFRVLCAVICLITLRNPSVIAGFEYQAE